MPIQLQVFPQDANFSVNILYPVVIFFVLSFFFQLIVMIPWGAGGYEYIFKLPQDDDITYEDSKNKGMWMKRMLYFNWMRFVEYSISGSLVLTIIAMVSGILDFELLTCMFVLSGACMLLGLVAEWSLRMYTVVQKLEFSNDIILNGEKGSIKHIFERQLRRAFFVSFFLAWFCIAVPWYIIIVHYLWWFSPCGTNSSQPPEAVKIIVWAQMILFASFGFVQGFQFFYPHRRRLAEFMYITLSFVAKGLLGITLAATVLVQD